MGVIQNIKNRLNSNQTPINSKFIIAAFGDPHTASESTNYSYESLKTALKQIEFEKWNIGLNDGDFFQDTLKAHSNGNDIVSQHGSLLKKIYSIGGNHDWDNDEGANTLLKAYIDAPGFNPKISGVFNEQRPYLIEGTYDAYRLKGTKNINIIMLVDRNEGTNQMGESDSTGTTVEKWRLSGGMTNSQWQFLHEQIFKHADKINIVMFHQPIRNTTICSGDGDFTAYGAWADYSREESDYRGCFGYINNVLAINEIQFFLEGVSGLIDFWLSGHVHHRLGSTYLTLGEYKLLYGIHHMNVCQLTKNLENVNSDPLTAHLWFIEFNDADATVTLSPWVVADTDAVITEGEIYTPEVFTVEVSKDYDANYSEPSISAPSSSATDLAIDNSTAEQLDLTFDNQGATGVLIVRKVGSHTTFTPSDDTGYYRGQTAGDGVVVFMGNIEALSDYGLTPTDDVYYSIFPFNGGGGEIKFKTSSPLQGNETVT